MKNLCPSRQEKHASEREREREKAKRFLDDNSKRSQKTLQGDWWIRKFQGCAVWTGVLAPGWDFVYRKQNIMIQTQQQDRKKKERALCRSSATATLLTCVSH